MGDSNRGIGLVDVLAPSTAGPVGVDAQVGGIDVDFDVVIDFRCHEDRGKGGVSTIPGIERRLANQTVNTGFRPQPAEGVVPSDMHGGTLDARHFARRALDEFALEPTRLTPAQIHAEQHFGPILRFGPTGTRLNVEECTHGIHLAAEHALEFKVGEAAFRTIKIGDDSCRTLFIVLLSGQLEEFSRVYKSPFDAAEVIDDPLEVDAFAAERLRPFGIVPDVGGFELALNFD